ncbi:MAG: galactokinase family protein [Planctomycetota bacterium]
MAKPRRGFRQVREWVELIKDSQSSFGRKLEELYSGDVKIKAECAEMYLRAVERFGDRFGKKGEVIIVHSTGRVNLLGMHIDHRGGSVNPIAIKEMIFVVEGRDDDKVVVSNVEHDEFPDEQFVISRCLPDYKIRDWDGWCHDELEKRRCDDSVTWSNYIRAAVLYIQHLYTNDDGVFRPALRGMNIMGYGNIPRGAGLSSSSSLVLITCEAVLKINDLQIDPMELVEGSGFAEWYVGTRGGCGDHAAIRFGRAGQILHMTNFPLTVETAPFPAGYKIVLANSMVVAKKRTGARNVFNNRVAAYVFGMMMIRKKFPQYADKLEHLRDVNPKTLGVDEAEIYRIIKSLPERATRQDILAELPEQEERIRHTFRSHDEPKEGYRIRQVCLYGIAECIRADMAPVLLRAGDIRRLGEVMNISHDGDRVSRLIDGQRVPVDHSYPDESIDLLIEAFQSDDAERIESSRLWRQSGGYDVSVPEMDELVDIALQCPGAAGAGLVGAGMGGSIAVLVEEGCAEQVAERMSERYYRLRGLPVGAEIVSPISGATVLEV